MLEQIFGSKTRAQLLRLFYNNPDESYYLRQLSRLIHAQLNSVRREILNLEKLGILNLFIPPEQEIDDDKKKTKKKKQVRKSKEKYFALNKEYVLYSELKALMTKADLLVERHLISKIKKITRLHYLVLTGFFIGKDDAPTDMLVVGTTNRQKFAKLIKQYERELNHSINYTIISLSEYKYRKDITDKFLYDILDDKKVVIVDKVSKD